MSVALKNTTPAASPWGEIDLLMKQEECPIDETWFSTTEFRERYKISKNIAFDRLGKLVAKGVLRVWKGAHPQTGKTTNMYQIKQPAALVVAARGSAGSATSAADSRSGAVRRKGAKAPKARRVQKARSEPRRGFVYPLGLMD